MTTRRREVPQVKHRPVGTLDHPAIACTHPEWEFPSPEPRPGTPCALCGLPYVEPGGTINGVRWRELSQEDREWIRALAAIRSSPLQADDGVITRHMATIEQQQIVGLMGWNEGEAHGRKRNNGVQFGHSIFDSDTAAR